MPVWQFIWQSVCCAGFGVAMLVAPPAMAATRRVAHAPHAATTADRDSARAGAVPASHAPLEGPPYVSDSVAVPARLPVHSVFAGQPGYSPPADPESLSVIVGRRLGAPLVAMRLAGGARSVDALCRLVIQALNHGARADLENLCVTHEEFTGILWREFPQSRPAAGVQGDDAWNFLFHRNHGGCGKAVSNFGEQSLVYTGFRQEGETTRYKNFVMHQAIVLTASTADGTPVELAFIRDIVERGGAFKLYALRD